MQKSFNCSFIRKHLEPFSFQSLDTTKKRFSYGRKVFFLPETHNREFIFDDVDPRKFKSVILLL